MEAGNRGRKQEGEALFLNATSTEANVVFDNIVKKTSDGFFTCKKKSRSNGSFAQASFNLNNLNQSYLTVT